MREILFRGKTKETGEWRYGFVAKHKYDFETEEVFVIEDEEGYWAEVIPETIGQFTGLTDKNGIKIFEGDICSYLTPEYKDNGVHYEPKRENGKVEITTSGVIFGGWQYSTPFGGCVSSIEIIGNIHDNQELLK